MKWITIQNGELKGYKVSENGDVKNQHGDIMKQYNHAEGYKRIRAKNGWYYVHRAVLEGFLPTDNPSLVADHIDNDRTNNHIDNLRWVTRRQNTAKAGREGKLSVYDKYKPIIVIDTDGAKMMFPSQAKASRQLHIPDCSINKALKGHRKTVHGYVVRYA